MRPYRTYSGYLRERYGGPVYRVAVDAGFSCPNRGPDRTSRGCIFCDADGSLAPYQHGGEHGIDVVEQVRRGAEFIEKRYGTSRLFLYFQAFSNTYAPPERLEELYDRCLGVRPFLGLIVSTRPDCLPPDVCDLLAGYRERGLELWVELGLQSSRDDTLSRIRRGHTASDFTNAYHALKSKGILVAVHLIFGLPGEGEREIMESVEFTSALRPDGVKIHNLHIPRGTELFDRYLTGEITVPGSERHLDYVISALRRLPPETVILRVTSDTPRERLAAPRTFWGKERFIRTLVQTMIERGVVQGDLYSGSDNRLAHPDAVKL